MLRRKTAAPARSPASRSPSSGKFINFWIGGGNHPGQTCINLLVDGKVVRTATGHNSNQMRPDGFDVARLQGKTARLEIVDKATGAWGNIGIGPIVFSDRRPAKGDEQHDVGTLALALLGAGRSGPRCVGCRRRQVSRGRFRGRSAATGSPARWPQAGRGDRSQDGFGSRPGSNRDLRHRLAFPAAEAQGWRQVLCHPL